MLMLVAVANLLFTGIGIWGINIPVGWGFDIINFVWWIGIGHAGTLISAILLLLRQEWRTSINRFAEAMTLFAVACAGIFPSSTSAAPGSLYWLFPYPNTMGLWPNFRSPLIWDVFAVSTYATVSALFWYVGLIPDFATLRDRAHEPAGQGHLRHAAPWAGAARRGTGTTTRPPTCSWPASRRRSCVSVHTVVSFDFAVGIVPGWHATIFPPYFVAGAIYAGFAMVLTLAHPAAEGLRARGLHHHAAPREHGQGHARDRPHRGLRLHDGSLHGLVQRRTRTRRFMILNRMTGPYALDATGR